MLRKSYLTTAAAIVFSATMPVFAGGTGDMGPRPAPVYHPAAPAPMETPTQAMRSCEGPTLKEGQWTLAARAGIAPTTNNKRGRANQRFVDGVTGGVLRLGSHDLHHHNTPFTAGATIGYVPMDNVEAFFDFEFATGSGKKRHDRRSITDPAGTITVSTRYKQDDFNSYGFYLGGRYFFDIDCRVSPFIGAKLGLISRNHGKYRVRTHVTQNNRDLIDASYRIHHHKNSTSFAGGVQAGFDVCVNDPVSLFVMAEAVGMSGGSHSHRHERQVFTSSSPRNDRLYASTERSHNSNFMFPITAGIRVRM